MNKFTLNATLLFAASTLLAETPTNTQLLHQLLQRIKVLENQKTEHTSDKSVNTKQLEKRIEALEDQTHVTPITHEMSTTNNFYDHFKIGGDYRFSIDNLNYDMASGESVKNDALLTNRLWLNFNYKPDNHILFNAKLAFNKVFGQPTFNNQPIYDQFDWFGATTNTDNQLRVKEAYIDYKDSSLFGIALPWDFGVGRRPTSYNKLINLRDDEAANSPLGHIVCAEFDGGHLGMDFSNLTGIKGAHIKLAIGRGISNIDPSISATPNADLGNNINMFAINVIPYADKNLHTELQVLKATNLVDITNSGFDMTGTYNPANYDPTLQSVGDIYLSSMMAFYNIEALNNTKVFASFAMSQTDPKNGQSMLGSSDVKIGTSYWIGTQMKSLLTQGGHWGAEFNHGSKYFRPFTYAEDTVIGSKIAARGNAYELYFTEVLAKGLTFQTRVTYIDYDYSGSNGFFGSQTGTPMSIADISSMMGNSDLANSVVDKATDVRFYLRYNF